MPGDLPKLIKDKNHHKTVSDRINVSSVSWSSKEAGYSHQKFSYKNINIVLQIALILSLGILSSVTTFAENISSNTLPTGGNVLAGNAVISKTTNSINVVQSSQR